MREDGSANLRREGEDCSKKWYLATEPKRDATYGISVKAINSDSMGKDLPSYIYFREDLPLFNADPLKGKYITEARRPTSPFYPNNEEKEAANKVRS